MSNLGIPTNLGAGAISRTAAVLPASPVDSSSSEIKKPTILVLDDNDSLRECFKDELIETFNVTEAANVAEANELLRVKKFDYILTDGFYDKKGGNLSDLITGLAGSESKGARIYIYTGASSHVHTEHLESKRLNYEVLDKSHFSIMGVSQKICADYETSKLSLASPSPVSLTSAASLPQVMVHAMQADANRKKTILVVDDNKFEFDYIQDALESRGEPFNLIYADTVDNAKEILTRGEKVDIVLSDGFVDGKGGTLSKLLPAITSDIRLIVNTASTRSINTTELDRRNLDYEIVDKSMPVNALAEHLISIGEVSSIGETVSVNEESLLPVLDPRMPLDEVTEGVLKSDLGANQKILIVDDSPETTDRLSRILGKYFTSDRGNEIFIANSAFDAANVAREKGITLLCTDLYMEPEDGIIRHPGLTNGDELLKTLGENCPAAVIISGSWSNDKYANLARSIDRFAVESTLEFRLNEATVENRLSSILVPILGASKRTIFYDEELLVKLCLSALSMGQDKHPDVVQRFLSGFHPQMIENENLENSSIVKMEEALLLSQAEFLRFRDRVDLNDFSVGREEIGKILQGVEKEFSIAVKTAKDLPSIREERTKSLKLHDIVNKRVSIASCLAALSRVFEQSGKNDLAIMARECEKLISGYAGDAIRNTKEKIESLAKPQDFLIEDEIKTLINSEFPNEVGIIKVSSNNVLIDGFKAEYLNLVKQLTMNSIKATRNIDNPLIRVSVAEQADPKAIVIEVGDNGCGMNGEQIRAINAQEALASTFGTSGDGMGFIYKTLEKLNADMEVRSDGIGMGATFKIIIPKDSSALISSSHQQSDLVIA